MYTYTYIYKMLLVAAKPPTKPAASAPLTKPAAASPLAKPAAAAAPLTKPAAGAQARALFERAHALERNASLLAALDALVARGEGREQCLQRARAAFEEGKLALARAAAAGSSCVC